MRKYTFCQFRREINDLGLRQSCGRTDHASTTPPRRVSGRYSKRRSARPPPAPRSPPSSRPSATAAAGASKWSRKGNWMPFCVRADGVRVGGPAMDAGPPPDHNGASWRTARPRRELARPLEDLVRPPQFLHLLLRLRDLGGIRAGGAGQDALVGLDPLAPAAQARGARPAGRSVRLIASALPARSLRASIRPATGTSIRRRSSRRPRPGAPGCGRWRRNALARRGCLLPDHGFAVVAKGVGGVHSCGVGALAAVE